MGLRPCQACKRDYGDHRARCPYCGAKNPSGGNVGTKGGGPKWLGKAMVMLVVLGVVNVWQATSREVELYRAHMQGSP